MKNSPTQLNGGVYNRSEKTNRRSNEEITVHWGSLVYVAVASWQFCNRACNAQWATKLQALGSKMSDYGRLIAMPTLRGNTSGNPSIATARNVIKNATIDVSRQPASVRAEWRLR